MQPEFILVTGANGTGKTTLIENNRSTLEAAGFQIIIPDNILKYATSHIDAPWLYRNILIMCYFKRAILF